MNSPKKELESTKTKRYGRQHNKQDKKAKAEEMITEPMFFRLQREQNERGITNQYYQPIEDPATEDPVYKYQSNWDKLDLAIQEAK